jgi:hypothetical protein
MAFPNLIPVLLLSGSYRAAIMPESSDSFPQVYTKKNAPESVWADSARCFIRLRSKLKMECNEPEISRSLAWTRTGTLQESPQTWQRSNRRLPAVRGRRLSIASPGTGRTFSVCRMFLPRLPAPTLSHVYRYFPFSPIALKHRERQRGCALRLGGLLLRYCACPGFGSSRFAGTLQESRPWHLGAASRSRPPGGVP